MQTGYDNFWMYQNNRHEQVLDLQKNDNYAYSVLTDNYKQMQNGRSPNNMIASSMNNTPTSYQNGQYRADTHCMWPSSMYSMPFTSSCANNYQSQSYPNHTSSFSYSSSKTGMRNTIAHNSQTSTGNNVKHVTTRLPQSSNSIDTEVARIRVKNVHALNNTSFCDSVLHNGLVETQNKKQYDFSYNYGANNHSRTCDFEANLQRSKHLPSSHVERAQPHLNTQEQFLQFNQTFYQQKPHLSTESQLRSTGFNSKHPFSISQPVENSINPKEVPNAKNGSTTVKSYKPKTAKYLHYLQTVGLENANNINYQGSAGVNENLTYDNQNTSGLTFAQSQNQNNLPNLSQVSPLSQVEDFRKRHTNEQSVTTNANSVHINNLENLVKITIPHTGESTYVTAIQPSNNDENSNICLRSLLESHTLVYADALITNGQRNVNNNSSDTHPQPEIDQGRRKSCTTPPGGNQDRNTSAQSNMTNEYNSTVANSNFTYQSNTVTSPKILVTSAQRRQQKPDDNLNRLEGQTSFPKPNNCVENFNDNVGGGDECMNASTEPQTISQNENDLNDLPIKQEFPEAESSTVQIDENITVDQQLEIIKTEEYSEDYELQQEPVSVEKPDNVGEAISSNSDEIRNTELVSKKSDHNSKITSIEQKNAENRSDSDKKEINRENIDNHDSESKKTNVLINEQNYKCQINRDKLDLLIQFLKKDDEAIETEKSDNNNEKVIKDSKKKEEISRSRRKLSKARIVKNKNLSREMVSMMSVKNVRSENQDTSKRPQSTKPAKEEPRSICADDMRTNGKVDDVSRKEVECLSLTKESEKQEKFDLKSEPEIKNSPIRENSVEDEKSILNVMQALQNLKSHFCLSCTLVAPVESFWINVASGELRCLNCFKKMNSKIDDSAVKLKKAKSDDYKPANFDFVPEEKIQKGNENNKFKGVCKKSSCVCTCEKSNNVIKQEPDDESTEDSTSCTSSEDRGYTSKPKKVERKDSNISDVPKKKSSEEQKKVEIQKSEDKTEDSAQSEIKTKRKPSLKDDSVPDRSRKSEERALTVSSRKKSTEEKSVALKKNTSKEEIKSPKTKVCSDTHKKERKHSSESKEQSLKTQNSKDSLERESRANHEKLARKSLSKDDGDSEVSKKDRRSSHHRKRTNSRDEFGSNKIRISEERMMDSSEKSQSMETLESSPEATMVRSPSESCNKSKTHSAKVSTKHLKPKNSSTSEYSYERHENKNLEKEKSAVVERKKRKSEDDVTSRKIRVTEDRLTDFKTSKHSLEKFKTKIYDSVVKKYFEHISVDSSQRRSNDSFPSKEQSKNEMKNVSESDKNRRNSTSKENISFSEYCKKYPYYEKNSETNKKQFLGKIPKLSPKSLEKGSSEAIKSPLSDEKQPKPKPSKSENGIKMSNEIFKKKEFSNNKPNHKEHMYEKITQKDNNDFKTTKETNFEKKNYPEKLHRHDKNLYWSIKHNKKDRALEYIFGKKKEEMVLKDPPNSKPPSAMLLNKLIQKTKKLSRTLLDDA